MVDIARLQIEADSTQARTASGDLDRLSDSAGRSTTSLFSMRNAVRMVVAALGGFTIIRTVQSSIGIIAGFGQSMAEVQAITRATVGEMEVMTAKARELGATTEFTASQAASAFKFLGMAGFNAEQSVAAIPDVLNLATAASMDLGRSADITSNIMSAFGIAADNASRVTDVLAAASSRANTNVEQLGSAMAFAGPVASSLGVDIGDTAAAIGALSDMGIQGGMAGTGLRRVMSSLIKPTTDAQKALASYGITTEEVNPATVELSDIVDLLRERGLDAADAFRIFGDRGAPAVLALIENNDKLRELSNELRDVEGESKRMADTMRDTLLGDARTLVSAMQELALLMGERLEPAMRAIVQATTEVVRAIGENIDTILFFVRVGGTMLGMLIAIRTAQAVGIAVKTAYTSALWLLSGGANAAAASLSRVHRAVLVLGAAIIGWQIGIYLRDQFAIVERAGIALMGGLHRSAVWVQGQFRVLGENMRYALTNPLDFAREKIMDFFLFMNSLGAGALRFLGLEGIADSMEANISRVRATTESELKASVASIRAETRASMQAIDDEYADMFARVGEGAEEVTKKAGDMALAVPEAIEQVAEFGKIATDEMDKLADAFERQFQAYHRQINLGNEATEAQTLAYEIQHGRLVGINAEQQRRLELMAQEIDAINEAAEASRRQADIDRQAQGIMDQLLSEEERLIQSYERRRAIIEQATFETEEARTRIMEKLEEDRAQRLAQMEAQRLSMIYQNYAQLFDSIAGLTGEFYGKQSQIYRIAFAAAKAFAISDSIVKIQQGLANAAAIPWPQNMAAMSQVAAQTAGIVSKIAGQNPSFEGGGFTGHGSRSGGVDGRGGFPAILHPNETVVDHTKGGQKPEFNATIVNVQDESMVEDYISSPSSDRVFVNKMRRLGFGS